MLTLGLKDIAVVDCAQLTDFAVCGAGYGTNIIVDSSGIGFESTGEEGVEVLELVIAFGFRLSHVDIIVFDEVFDEGVLDPWLLTGGNFAN
jgi:hypothetical protein